MFNNWCFFILGFIYAVVYIFVEFIEENLENIKSYFKELKKIDILIISIILIVNFLFVYIINFSMN